MLFCKLTMIKFTHLKYSNILLWKLINEQFSNWWVPERTSNQHKKVLIVELVEVKFSLRALWQKLVEQINTQPPTLSSIYYKKKKKKWGQLFPSFKNYGFEFWRDPIHSFPQLTWVISTPIAKLTGYWFLSC